MKSTMRNLPFVVVLSLLAMACGATATQQTTTATAVSKAVAIPTSEPTAAPTEAPTATSTTEPTPSPTDEPIAAPTTEPTTKHASLEMSPTVTSGFANVNGTRLYYETAGDGDAVVFIHDFGGNTREWDLQFAEFSERYKTVTYDMRGFGQSDAPTDQPYAHADDLKALLDYLGIESAHVIGHSFGGEIALNFALAYPEMTQSLVLIEPDVPGAEGLPAPTEEEQAAFEAIFAALEAGDPAAAAAGLVDNHPIFAVSRDIPSVREFHLRVLADYQWYHFTNEDPVVQPQPPISERLGEIAAPTVLFVGDSTTEYQTMIVDLLAEKLPNARKIVVKNSDHFPHILFPDDFNARVWEFLDEVKEMPTQAMESSDKPEVVKSFDAARSELPEGIAIDTAGNIYVSLGPPLFVGGGFGEIWKISPDGSETTLAQFEGGPPAAGLAVDAAANLYYAYPSGEEETQGVYRLTVDGDTERLEGTEAIVLANGLALDNDGDLYVSDSVLGTIWRIPPGGSAEPWLQHELLAGCPPDDPYGANGVAVWDGKLYAANTAKGLVVRIPILTDGSAGEPEKVAGVDDCDEEFDDLDGMDGIALGADGNVYALLVMQNKLVRIDPTDGTFTVLLTENEGLHNPASIVFGVTKDSQESVFFTNYAVLPPEPPASPGPAVLKFDVGVAGLPLPAAADAISPAPTPEIKSESVEIAYEDRVIRGTLAGDGKIAVVLAPMFDATRAYWMRFARDLAAAGYAAVAFDLPGTGASTGKFSYSRVGPDTSAVVDFMQARGYEQVVCMGASMGAWGCFGAALADPELAGLVLLSGGVETTKEEAAGLLMPKLLIAEVGTGEVIPIMTEMYQQLPQPKQFVRLNTTAHGTGIFNSNKKEELHDLLTTFLEGIR